MSHKCRNYLRVFAFEPLFLFHPPTGPRCSTVPKRLNFVSKDQDQKSWLNFVVGRNLPSTPLRDQLLAVCLQFGLFHEVFCRVFLKVSNSLIRPIKTLTPTDSFFKDAKTLTEMFQKRSQCQNATLALLTMI